ncbi:MAG: hypothetical protein WC326_06485 [Candidatus Delongbacteria bacterium]
MRHLISLALLLGMGGAAAAEPGSARYRLPRHCLGAGADAAAAPSSGHYRMDELALEGPSGPRVAGARFRGTPGYLQGGPGWLPAPTDLVLTVGVDLLQLTWTAVAGAIGYEVRSSVVGYTGFAPDGTGSFAGASWSAPLPGERHFYQVQARR